MDWSDYARFSDNNPGGGTTSAALKLGLGVVINRKHRMVAANQRMAVYDLLLVSLSAAVIVLASWPKGQARQIVQLRSPDGGLQTYSLAIDDPRLADVQRQLKKWSKPRPDASVALARWRAEVADYYARRTDPNVIDASVVQVAFTDQEMAREFPPELVARHEFWIRTRDAANASVVAAQARIDRERSIVGPPAVFSSLIPGRHSWPAYLGAIASGLALAIAFAVWAHMVPPISLATEREASIAGMDRPRAGELQLAIPARWVRVHQPLGVNLRRFTFASLVFGALGCLLSL